MNRSFQSLAQTETPALSDDQQAALLTLTRPESEIVFVTGKAGTGKSTLLRELVASTNAKAAVLAPTGLAALNAGGQTIHSFFGIKPGPVTNDTEHIHRYSPRSPKGKLINELEVLVIDEISMVRADLMDGIDYAMRINTGCDEPFGGRKVILFGDLLQLEPVVKRGAEQEMLADRYESPFFFDAEVMRNFPMHVMELTTVHRQASDSEMLWALNEIRQGNTEVLETFNERIGAPIDETKTLTLFTLNAGVRAMNASRLMEIPSEPKVYQGITEGDFYNEYPTEVALTLKVGARVMFVRNGTDWVNGTLGTVLALDDKSVKVQIDDGDMVDVEAESWEKVKWTWDGHQGRITGEVVGSFSQIPLKLAWALTVHKSQGLTFDTVRLAFDNRAFAHGQLYVALSRCRTLEGLSLRKALKDEDLIVNERVYQFWNQLGLS